ncbi:PDZ domain-containing protein [Pseudodesulfovibrio cashew]|uniref:PDZ domain-containing protein n=1 Tax=Pseudodesulfovibrio cashew TaxID=2678688 RepID=A0A6I6JAA0_9BACT|nr:ChaN family lipoprotein [Pseudodesulfovibrio cashew]QGY39615.1 PDZ domain-containing protein [Pseudodesulfovibrio cashew]
MQCNFRNPILAPGRVLTLLALALALGACARHVEHPPLEVTFLPQRGDFLSNGGDQLSLEEITAMAKGKDYILIGEGHTNGCDHNIQQRVLAALAASDAPPAVGLEMVSVDMQPVLNDFCKGQVEVDGLEEELQWSTRWGYPFSLFRGLFELAQRHSLPVAGLNVPTQVTRKIAREGMDALTDEERAFLPSEIVPPSNDQVAFLDEVFAQHEARNAADPVQRERFHLVQSIWDSKMAEEAVRLRKQYEWPVLVIAGGGHVENGWGIARRIRRFDPGARILIIMPWRGGEFDGKSGDALFYCPESYESRMGALLTATGYGGLLVERVQRESRADKAGLRPGDVLLEAGGVQLDHLFDLHMAGFKVHEKNAELVFTVRRGRESFPVSVGKLGQRSPGSASAKHPASGPVDKKNDTGKEDK